VYKIEKFDLVRKNHFVLLNYSKNSSEL